MFKLNLSIFVSLGLCVGRVTRLNEEGKMRSEENGGVLRVSWVGQLKALSEELGMGPTKQ